MSLNKTLLVHLHARRGPNRVELEIFGTERPEAIVHMIETWVADRLDPVSEWFFVQTSVGATYGLQLTNGRRILVKGHSPRLNPGYLTAVQQVQTRVADAGLPAPRPLVAPEPLGFGWITAETWRAGSNPRDAHQALFRRGLARGLVRVHELCQLADQPSLRKVLADEPSRHSWSRNSPFPEPDNNQLDFTIPAGQPLDELARAVADQRQIGTTIIGHSDWRIEHAPVDERGRVTAIYDWDSLTVQPEPVLLASAAHSYSADWSQMPAPRLPTLLEMEAFIADYLVARVHPLNETELQAVWGNILWQCCYSARCELSDAMTDHGRRRPGGDVPPPALGSQRALLAEHGLRLLRRAGRY